MSATSAAQPARPPHAPARVPASCDVPIIQIVAAIVCLAVTQQTAALPAWYLRWQAEVTFTITKPAASREREKRPIVH